MFLIYCEMFHPGAVCGAPQQGNRSASSVLKNHYNPANHWMESSHHMARLDSVLVGFHDNRAPPNIRGVVISADSPVMSFARTPKQRGTSRRWYTGCSVYGFLSDSRTTVVFFYDTISPHVDFHVGETLVIY